MTEGPEAQNAVKHKTLIVDDTRPKVVNEYFSLIVQTREKLFSFQGIKTFSEFFRYIDSFPEFLCIITNFCLCSFLV